MRTQFLEATCKHFENITDSRINRGKNHQLIEMIFLTLCSTICGADGWADVERFGKAKIAWLRRFLPFELGVPSHDTLGRVFSRLDSVEFYSAMQSWMMEIAGALKGETVAFDGKTLRGSFDTASSKSPLHSVSAWACGLRLCLGLNSVDSKSNEIPAVQDLIDMLDLQGAVVTADAMHCQKATAEKIINKQADYILIVKGNQPTLQTELQDAIVDAFECDSKAIRQQDVTEKNRNREELRSMMVMPVPKDSQVLKQWQGIKTIGQIYRTREFDDKVEEELSFFISSLPPRVREHNVRVRQHWSTENQQHYVLDVTFSEDSSRIRKGTAPEISSVFRRLALSILQQDTTMKDSIRGKRKRCGWDEAIFEKLLANFSSK